MYNGYYGQNDDYGYPPAAEPYGYRYNQRTQDFSRDGSYTPAVKRKNPYLLMLFSLFSVFALLGIRALVRYLINGDGQYTDSEFFLKSFFLYIIYTALDYIYLIVPFVFAFVAYKKAKNRVLFVASCWSSVVIFNTFFYMTSDAWTYFRWQGYIGDTVLQIAKIVLCITSIVIAGGLAMVMIYLNEKSPEAETKTVPALKKDGVYWTAGILPALFTIFSVVLSFLCNNFMYSAMGDEAIFLNRGVLFIAMFAYIGAAYGLASYYYRTTNQRLVYMLAVLGCTSIGLGIDKSAILYYFELFIFEKILPYDIYYYSSAGYFSLTIPEIVMMSAVAVLLMKIADGSIRLEKKR